MKFMKLKHLYWMACILSVMGIVGCESMDDNYKQYLNEYNYSGKILNLRCYLGYQRVALAWDNPKDQKSKKIMIEYGAEKLQKTFDSLVDTVVIEGLNAGTGYDFTVYTLDNAGNHSVPVSVTALPVSKDMADNLVPPTCTYVKVGGEPAIHWVTLSAVSMSFCKQSRIEYSVTAADGSVVKQGVFRNANEESLVSLNEYTLPVPELEAGKEYNVDFTVYVYPVSSNIVTMDAVPVTGSTRIVVD